MKKTQPKPEKTEPKKKKSYRSDAPSWVEYSPEDVEALILKLAKGGRTPSVIGGILRDQYGIPNVKSITGKRINRILEENKMAKDIPEDIMNLIKKAVNLREHIDTYKKDAHSKRGLQMTEAKIMRLTKYYKRVGKLPRDWNYNPQTAKLLVK